MSDEVTSREGSKFSYMTGTREAKEVTETRSGDVSVEVVKKVAKTAKARTTDFFSGDRALI